MAIDTKSVSQLIAEFRKLQAKDSITPESLGYILQRIADLLATAGTSETVAELRALLDGLKKAGTAVSTISQGQSDRNHIYADKTVVNLATGEVSSSSGLFIQQATTERAGAMRAQQVTDLNAARKNVTELQKQMEQANNIIDTICVKLGLTSGNGVIVNSQISCLIIDGELHIMGASNLINNGYVPYLFRNVRKRAPFKDKDAPAEKMQERKYCPEYKGWGVFGSIYTLKIVGTRVKISTNPHCYQCIEARDYSDSPDYFVTKYTDKNGDVHVGYGRSSIILTDKNCRTKKERMIRLRYAIGFAKPIYPGRGKITPANLASSLAEFSLIYNPSTQSWSFGKCPP